MHKSFSIVLLGVVMVAMIVLCGALVSRAAPRDVTAMGSITAKVDSAYISHTCTQENCIGRCAGNICLIPGD